MALADPTETHRLFQRYRVATGYAAARPYLHPEVFGRVRGLIRPVRRLRRALDVGCGTGLSAIALLEPLFAGAAHRVRFGGYIQALSRI